LLRQYPVALPMLAVTHGAVALIQLPPLRNDIVRIRSPKPLFCPAPPPLSPCPPPASGVPRARVALLGAQAPGLLQTPFRRRSTLKSTS
jgi:hypothetical protein